MTLRTLFLLAMTFITGFIVLRTSQGFDKIEQRTASHALLGEGK